MTLDQLEQHYATSGTLRRADVLALLRLGRAAQAAAQRGWHAPACLWRDHVRTGIVPECTCGREQLLEALTALEEA